MNRTLTAEALHLPRGFFQIPFVRAVEKEFGFKGSKLLMDILFEVTETGFERPYNRPFREAIAGRNGVSERLVDMVVHRMVKNGYLDPSVYVERHILAIPATYILTDEVQTRTDLPYYFTIPSEIVSSEETTVNSEEIPIISEETPNNIHSSSKNTHYGTTKEARS